MNYNGFTIVQIIETGKFCALGLDREFEFLFELKEYIRRNPL